MSVTSAMYTGVSGLLNYGESINVLGNNIANVNTTGFKSSRTLFADMLYANVGNNSQVGRGVAIQKVDTNFSQGSSQNTSNVTDLAIQGSTFFALGEPGGNAPVTAQANAYLTRAGAFHVDKDLYLVNPEGYQVLDTDGEPIQFYSAGTDADNFSKVTKIDANGVITFLAKDGVSTYYYTSAGDVGAPTSAALPGTANKVAVVSVKDVTGLEKLGGNLLKPTASAGVTGGFSRATNTANGNTEKVLSNTLEMSNVDLATEFVSLITTQRAYSANSKTITTADEMTQELLNLKR